MPRSLSEGPNPRRAPPGPGESADPGRNPSACVATLGAMDYVSALLPPLVMAVFFVGVIRVIVKTQGGANKAKEDAAVDAALARAESTRQASTAGDA